jgi:TorA maturation chaperone TorD
LREKLRELGLARTDTAGVYEDHIASLCEVMRHLVLQGSGVAAMQQQKDFFIAYIQPCCELFSSKIISAEQVDFYKSVGRFGKAFFDIEAEALAMV